MGDVDDDFNDFLKRRKPVFRSPDDLFEPPAELDRVVLRQAREAIESERPARVFRNPRWAMPLALAATLVLGFTVMFYAGLPQQHAQVPEVSVQNIAERVDMPPAPAPMETADAAVANNQTVVVDLNAPMVARQEPEVTASPSATSAAVPAWRRDAKAWLAEIERLRDTGDTARAEAELAEYKRQQRAYAGAPDR
jgi:hypothetical protein